jgi:hypothetical protein
MGAVRRHSVDFRIQASREVLDSTGYIEIGPGRYKGKHWQPGFIFVWEDAFGFAEGILAKHVDGYDHFAMNDIHIDVGARVVADWRRAANAIADLDGASAVSLLHFDSIYRAGYEPKLRQHRKEVAAMLATLAERCEGFYKMQEWVCVLGM